MKKLLLVPILMMALLFHMGVVKERERIAYERGKISGEAVGRCSEFKKHYRDHHPDDPEAEVLILMCDQYIR